MLMAIVMRIKCRVMEQKRTTTSTTAHGKMAVLTPTLRKVATTNQKPFGSFHRELNNSFFGIV